MLVHDVQTGPAAIAQAAGPAFFLRLTKQCRWYRRLLVARGPALQSRTNQLAAAKPHPSDAMTLADGIGARGVFDQAGETFGFF
jgi:hypothetical protein